MSFIDLLLDEYRRWRDSEFKSRDDELVQMGAMGALANVVANSGQVSAEPVEVTEWAPQGYSLPDDLAEAFEAFKLAIKRHATSGWIQIRREEVVGALMWLRKHADEQSAAREVNDGKD